MKIKIYSIAPSMVPEAESQGPTQLPSVFVLTGGICFSRPGSKKDLTSLTHEIELGFSFAVVMSRADGALEPYRTVERTR